MINNVIIKLLLSISFIFIATSSVLLLYSSITGYEISIYDSTPAFVWISLFFTIACGIGLIFYFIWNDEKMPCVYWILSIMLIIIARLELLYIPLLRGYIALRGDNLSHIGNVIDILKYSHIGNNIYPVTHILCSKISLITSLPPISFMNYITGLFSVFFVLSTYLLLKTTSLERKEQFLAFVVAGGILFDNYNIYIMPNGWSLFFLPFILYVALQAREWNVSAIFTLLLVFFVFFHPLSYLITIAILMLCTMCYYILKNSEYFAGTFDNSYTYSLIISTILSFILFSWYIISYQRFEVNIHIMWNSITSGGGIVPIAHMSDKLNKIHFELPDFIELLIKMNGDELIYLIFLISASYFLVRRCFKKCSKVYVTEAIFVAIPIQFGGIFAFYLLHLIPGLESIGSSRLLSYTAILTPISSALVLNNYISNKNKIMSILCIVLILVASLLSILSLYPSPYVFQANPAVTNMDMTGMGWAANSTIGSDYQYVNILSPVTRFQNAILGTNATKVKLGKGDSTIIDHFGYKNNTYLGKYYDKTMYFTVTQMDQIIYDTVSTYAAVARFNKYDFVRLNQDITVNRLYHNGESFVCSIN